MLDKQRMEKIYEIQRKMQDKFRNTPKSGEIVTYMGIRFIVYPTVFWPSQDSVALVQSREIRPGERVLDVCTGSGVIAVFAALRGASVVALDINPEAIRCAKENARRQGLEKKIDARVSDMFDSLDKEEIFDVITMNPPFTPHRAGDYAERTVWDQDLHLHKIFFQNVDKYLMKNGRIYLSHSNFGAVDEMKSLAKKAGFDVKLLNERPVDENRTFYAFELKRESG